MSEKTGQNPRTRVNNALE